MLPEEVAIIKIGAQTKGDNMEARGNVLTNHHARQTAFTKIIALIIPQGTKCLLQKRIEFKAPIIEC